MDKMLQRPLWEIKRINSGRTNLTQFKMLNINNLMKALDSLNLAKCLLNIMIIRQSKRKRVTQSIKNKSDI